MLYDPKWEKQTQTEPRSLESLIAWLETQPPKRQYDYCLPDTCLIAEWLKAMGEEDCTLPAHEVKAMFGGRGASVVKADSSRAEWTYGAALKRARALLAEKPR